MTTTITLRALKWLIHADNVDIKRHRTPHTLVVF